ncbi:MAG: hypothetical protein COA43_00455 [Robiginitomaculum sp.]|nr:MAG: hypothetical protein COA43_00455 [Robiginitomaculum sp.]
MIDDDGNNIISFPILNDGDPSTEDYLNLLLLFGRIKGKKRRDLLLKKALDLCYLDASDRGINVHELSQQDPDILQKLYQSISSELKPTLDS